MTKNNQQKLVRMSTAYIFLLLFVMVSNGIKNDWLTLIIFPIFMIASGAFLFQFIKMKIKKN